MTWRSSPMPNGSPSTASHSLVTCAHRQAPGRRQLGRGQRRIEPDRLLGQQRHRHRDDRGAAAQPARGGHDGDLRPAPVEGGDRRAQGDRQPVGETLDQAAIARDHAPVDRRVGVAREVDDRELLGQGARDEAGDGGEIGQPGIAARQALAQRPVRSGMVLDRAPEPVEGLLARAGLIRAELTLAGERGTPVRQVAVDLQAQLARDRGPGIAVGGMQPAAAQIGGTARECHGPGSAADPVARLEHLHAGTAAEQAPGRGHAGSTGADDDDVGLGGQRSRLRRPWAAPRRAAGSGRSRRRRRAGHGWRPCAP